LAKNFIPKIVAFCCNWSTYPFVNEAKASDTQFPPNIKFVKMMCGGMVTPALILKAFELGADGVFVATCRIEDCHYITGARRAVDVCDDTERLIDMLGFEPGRFKLGWFSSHEPKVFEKAVNEFINVIKKMGPSPIKMQRKIYRKQEQVTMTSLKSAIKDSKAYLCLECGKCTSVCPVSQFNRGFSPRVLVNRTLRYSANDILTDKNIWACLTCAMCDLRCPADIAYIDLTQAIRLEAKKLGEEAICSHGGAAQAMMRIMTATNLQQKRMDWIDNDLKVAEKGEVLYFVGCLPHFDILLGDIGVHTIRDAKSSVKILNYLGITPVIMPQERCCGHDLLWSGDIENFKKLAEYNINEIKKTGAKKVVFSCPEGYRTFKIDYPKYFDVDFEMQHITELLRDAINEGKLKFKEIDKVVTFQDPCRLGRHLGIYDAPREVLSSIQKLKLADMPRSKKRAVCCGVSAWMNCSLYSKKIQMLRLKEAKETGADVFVLSCPKCEIHFNCAMKEENERDDIKIPTEQLVTFVADALT